MVLEVGETVMEDIGAVGWTDLDVHDDGTCTFHYARDKDGDCKEYPIWSNS
jgi:hypothetical protein